MGSACQMPAASEEGNVVVGCQKTLIQLLLYAINCQVLLVQMCKPLASITLTQSHVRWQLLFTSAFKFFLTHNYPSVAYHIKVLVLDSKWSFSSNTHVSSHKEPCRQNCMSIQPLYIQHPLGPSQR